jgi:hypothetical protein
MNNSDSPEDAHPPRGEYLVGGEMMTYRQEVLRVYNQESKMKPVDMPQTWPYSEEWWNKLPVELQLVHKLRHHSWKFEPPKRTIDDWADRRGQWAQPNLVEVDVSMPYEYISIGEDIAPVRRERVIDYSIPDLEWVELTKEEQQRLMAL